MRRAAPALALMLLAGCVRHAGPAARRAASPPAVATTMRRQVLNAAITGSGDPVVIQLREQIAARPDSAEPRLELAAHFARSGYPELELEHLRVAVDRFPASRAAHMALAQALRKNGQPRQGALILERFLRANPAFTADPEVWNRLGICHDEAGDWPAGEQAFRSGLQAAGREYLYNNLGFNLLQQGRVPEAVSALREALRLQPRSETARNNLGLALARLEGATVQEALQHFENVADAATARSNLAAALIEQQRYEESRRLLEAALDYNRSHAVALANLSLLAELEGKPAPALPARRRVTAWRWPAVITKKIVRRDRARFERPVQAAKGETR